MQTKNIKIADIRIDGGTQQRDEISPAVVNDYAEAMRCGAKFPAVTVFFDGVQYWLADGFHRYHASVEIEALSILADVESGMVEDAILFSVGANKHHGLNRTNAEKKKSVFVLLKHPKWSLWTAREISKHCGVSHSFVNDLIKKEADSKYNTAKNEEQPQKPITKDKSPESTKVEAASTTPPEPSTGLVSENPAVAESLTVEESCPQADEEPNEQVMLIDALESTVEFLTAENERLSDKNLALGSPEEVQGMITKTFESLRAENKTLKINLDAVTRSRDQLMNENASLKKQVKIEQARIKKLTGKK